MPASWLSRRAISDAELCSDCSQLASIYNVYQDGEDVLPYAARIRKHIKSIQSKGGNPGADAMMLLHEIAFPQPAK